MKTKKYMLMLAAAMALAACTNDESLAPAPADALAAMNPETRIGISAELGGELTASRNTTTEAVYAMSELHGTKSDVNFTLNLPGGVKTQLYPTGENGYPIPIAFNALAEKLPLFLKDFNLTEGNGRCVSRWTILGANSSNWDNSLGWARLAADETGKPKLSYTLQRSDAKVTLKVVDAEGKAINMKEKITAKFNMTNTSVTPIYTGAGDPTNGYPALNFYLSDITTLAADDAVDANKIKLAVYDVGNTVTDYFSSLVDAAGKDLADDHAYSSKNGYVSAIVLATPTYTENNGFTYFTPIASPAFADTDEITITVPDDCFAATSNQVGGTYKLKMADIVMADNSKLTHLAPGDHLTVTVTLSHNSVASATATLGSWTEVGAEGGAAAGWDAEAFGKGNIVVTAEMNADAVRAAVAEVLDAGVRDLCIMGNLRTEQLAAVGNAIRAFEGAKNGTNAGTVSLTMPDETTIPASATLDNTGAFVNCYALKRVSMPALSEIIGDRAFYNCSALTEITLADNTGIGEYAFENCTSLATVNGTLSGTIGSRAFYNCSALTEITLADNTVIGSQAFRKCTSLATVNGTLSGPIGESAFSGCTSLTEINLADEAVIDNYAFNFCSKLATVNGTLSGTIGNYAFYNCSALTEINLADNGTSIGDWAFYNCTSLATVKGKVSGTIGNDAFGYCSELTAITLENVTSIGNGAFYECSKLATVNGKVSGTIGLAAFGYCSKLTKITLGDGVSIGDNAFYNCTGMTSLTLKNVVTSVGAGAFLNVGNGYCDLTLASGQKEMELNYEQTKYVATETTVTASETSPSWCGNTWKSITINTNE